MSDAKQEESESQAAVPSKRPPNSGLVGESGNFATGAGIVVAGIQSQPELNGKLGEVRGFDKQKGRYAVAIEGREQPISLKPANIYIQAAAIDDTATDGDFTVDISPFMENGGADVATARRLVAAEWDATFRKVGFARIVGHGVSPESVAALRKAAKAFFDKPDSEKNAYHRPNTGKGSYVPLWSAKSSGLHDDPVEGYTFVRLKDGWHLTRPELQHPLELAVVAEKYCREVEKVMHTLHRLSAAALGLKPEFFDSAPGTGPASLLVISHYPAFSELGSEVNEGQMRYRAHSDYTGFTILLQDESDHGGPAHSSRPEAQGNGGLEIDIDGSWMPVIPRPGSFVVNIGDLFELWTNNRWRSTPHRVSGPRHDTASMSQSRLTAMLFTGPSLETIVLPAPTCGPSIYPTVTARQHLTAMAMSKSKEAKYKKEASGYQGAGAKPSTAPK
eukprot:gnl/TRDRNA2_/TRDRNA2_198934_c0_seq1.p1 gnl/TRDRNA2_/TRDRNA2_198934_c0~~gnl/TRDRNA2_/TRDRNA2_198934_c0_seq1.p1  ORF type:complete len:446 (+),score=73.78 gnl/TRDRNA2_/TRDRNA2_198934_c0_seq1:121-1458(+)